MSHAKETPRQKMINLMYLVLTCMLALNVSREVLQGFVTINESIETTNLNFSGNIEKIKESVEEAIANGHHEFEPYNQKIKQVTTLGKITFEFLDTLKKEVIKYTEDVEGADTLKLAEVENLDDYDKPTYFLLGSNENQPKEGRFSARELRQKIQLFTDSLNGMLDHMKDKDGLKLPEDDYKLLKGKLKLFTPDDNTLDKEGLKVKWENKNFYNLPLAAVITNLSKMQGDVRNIEGEMVSAFASAPGKLAVKFNEMQARIVPVSKYVQAGTPFTADVFLSAASSDFEEDNLQFILGEMDTATGKMDANAVVLPIEKGTGKINIPSTGVGRKEINGWIKFREGTGVYKYFRYQNEYVVAQPFCAVSADKMNVLYSGVDNPISVSAAGVAPTDLVVQASGCNAKLVNNGNGKYIATVAGSGTCLVTVFEKRDGQLKQQGQPQLFRVKKIPSPPLRIGGMTVLGNLDLKVNEAKNIYALGVDNTGFNFNAPFNVLSFEVTIGGNGVPPQPFKCQGNTLSPAALQYLRRLRPGCKMYFEDIMVQAPDGRREFPIVKVTVK